MRKFLHAKSAARLVTQFILRYVIVIQHLNLTRCFMKDNVKKSLYEALKAIVSAICGALIALFTSSCGSTTKAIIKNSATSTSTTVSITTNNPTNWEVNPSVPVELHTK